MTEIDPAEQARFDQAQAGFRDIDPEVLAGIRLVLEATKPELPEEPGHYIDSVGDLWILDEDGLWADKHGIKGPIEDNWILLLGSPYQKEE